MAVTPPGAPPVPRPSFGDPSRYRDVRPAYLPTLVARVEELCDRSVSLTCRPTVLDVGCGSGALARHLPRCQVVGVDPDPGMLAHLAGAAVPVGGRAEALPVGDASVAACVVGVAYHWFARPAALDELVRATAPDGTVVLVGYECVHPAVGAARDAALARCAPAAGPAPAPGPGPAFDPGRFAAELDGHDGLGPAALDWASSVSPASRDEVVGLLSSFSWARHLADDEVARCADAVAAGGDGAAPSTLPWRWHLVWAQRR